MKKFTKVFCFMLIFSALFSFNVMAANVSYEDLPSFDSIVSSSDYDGIYVIEEYNGNVRALFYTFPQHAQNMSAYFQFTSSNQLSIVMTDTQADGRTMALETYTLTNGAWKYAGRNTATGITEGTSHALNTNLDYIVHSSAKLYDIDGNLVFPVTPTVPLHQVPKEIMETEKAGLVTYLVEAMKTITIIAVGFLALLISLHLFGKVSRIFRVK